MDKSEHWFYSYLPTNMAGGCFDSLLPVFIVLALNGSVGDVALVSIAASFTAVPSLIFWGKASDFMKWRKHFIVLGFLGRAIAYTAMGFSVGTHSLLFASILMGLLASASTPAMSILILESFRKEHWSEKIGLFNNIAGIGNLAGIALGFVWIAMAPTWFGLETSLRLLFLLNAVLALVGTWLAFILIIEPEEKISRETFHEHLFQIFRWAQDRGRYLPERVHHFFRFGHLKNLRREHSGKGGYVGWFLASTFIYNIGAVGFFTIAPVFLIVELRLGGALVFILSFIQALASTLLFKSVGRFSDHGNKPRLLFLAKTARFFIFGLYVAVIPILAISELGAVAFLILLHLAMGATWAIIADTQLPIAVGSEQDEHKGSHAGVFNASVGLGAIAGGAIGGIVATSVGFASSILLCSCIILASAIVLRLTVQPRVKAVEEKGATKPNGA
ncbi:MAG: MFS transporter [Candidatus Thermoplasmatota archaeon]|nr:MFS transporter [Euryarchaeota archaeon]MBU4032217.1 MFS transporter [Candidatus Thermoplasmatota archaeon]MBU4070997.1 MFS transporter [Candidatus Thermoplasmatota archaeon]MBU4143962.1 MFS transporter [Candidatus Thermoplasmatota archaeon]MBU4592569.1 MFS transporter [Candidatus Thermoplasmatota archaeon]